VAISLSFLGGAGSVTASKYALENHDTKLLVDCGLFQGFKALRLKNWAPFPIAPRSIKTVILTHAHLDHSGYLPLLVKHGFAGPIHCSKSTADLCEILWPDAGHLQEKDAKFANRHGFSKHKPALPLYDEEDARKALKHLALALRSRRAASRWGCRAAAAGRPYPRRVIGRAPLVGRRSLR
jgi:metallo-beta-lactamase family protein